MSTDREELRLNLEAQLQAAAAPFVVQLEMIDTVIGEQEQVLKDLHEQRRIILQAVVRMLPNYRASGTRSKPSKSPRVTASPEKAAIVRAAIEDHFAGREFVVNELHQWIQSGPTKVGLGTVYEVVRGLHDQGVLRLVRKTVGGGSVFALVGAREADDGEA